jgi:ATP-dependent Clp protease ATP-binding subunit ClpC
MEKYDMAESCYLKAISLEPEEKTLKSDAYNDLAILSFYNLNRIDESLKYLKEAIKIDPRPLYYNNMGLLSEELGDLEKGFKYWKDGLKLDSESHDLLYNIGRYHLIKKNYSTSKEIFTKLLSLYPNSPFSHFGMGIYFEDLGQRDEAIKYFKNVLRIDQNFERAKDRLVSLGVDLLDIEDSDNSGNPSLDDNNIFGQLFDDEDVDNIKKNSEDVSDKYTERLINFLESEDDTYDLKFEDDDLDISSEIDELKDEEDISFVNEIGRDLNKLASEGKLNRCFGREKEIQEILEVLFRRTKNNPLIIGEPGVGKTAIVEGIAQRIVDGNVPEFFRNKRIVELSVGLLVSGTTYRGQLEKKIEMIIENTKNDPDLILFIDEIHTIVGAGRSEGGNLDISQMLKPALARGELTCIGATTLKEYKKYFEKDSALDRRFYPIKINEMNQENTFYILKENLEKAKEHYGINITEKNILEIVELSDKYIKKRYLPDKAIDIFEKVAAKCALSGKKRIDSTDIKDVVSESAGINFLENDPKFSEILLNLPELLKKELFGQDEAIDKVCNILKVTKRRLDLRPERPDGIFLFTGQTGVGKTFLAKILCKYLYGSENKLIRLDMSEFRESYSISKIIGSPPGYVGHDEPSITSVIEDNPTSILLLDEIEKAHPDVMKLFLQIFDEGKVTDSKGKNIYFSDIIIIMTSNVMVKHNSNLGFVKEEGRNSDRNNLLKAFPREFLNRIDEVIYFKPLTKKIIKNILVNNIIKNVKERFRREKIKVEITEQLIDYLVNKGFSKEYGARNLERVFEKEVISKLASFTYEHKCRGKIITAYLEDEKIKIKLSE